MKEPQETSPSPRPPSPPVVAMNDTPRKENDDEKTKDKDGDKDKDKGPLASARDVLSFVDTRETRTLFAIGCVSAVANGMVYPILAYLFSNSFSDLGGAADGLAEIRRVAYSFLVVGAYAFVAATLQHGCLEIAAAKATRSFRLAWFAALLRQDAAFFDVNDVSGVASSLSPNSTKFRRGLGRKFGEGIQFFTTFVGGIIYAFYSSWKVALVVLAVLPLVSVTALAVMKINQNQTARSTVAYSAAGSVAYSTVSAIRTVLSLNAVPEMIRQYTRATLEAYNSVVGLFWKQGFVNGMMLGSFIFLYCILTLYGTSLLYNDVSDTGCDPSAGVDGADTCDSSGPDVFGAMLGVAFAGQGMSQVANTIEAFTMARAACYPAMVAIRRRAGASDADELEMAVMDTDDTESERDSFKEGGDGDEEKGSKTTKKKKTKAVLPKYVIDSSSKEGSTPHDVRGSISFRNVHFSYPTRPDTEIFRDFNLDVEAGTTVALVGPSGGGKSTTVALIERFYDPTAGSVSIDGYDLTELNVKHLRSMIGYVGQEPALFATTVAGNIAYGSPDATQEQIEEAAKLANAHDFIMSFPDGYDTQVGDKGAQLSGGQKQRVAIARVLVANPKILLLDEATSALDSESELVVQEALDKLLTGHKRTTLVIAHRLSTIHNADVIAVIQGGKVVEKGSHDELMESPSGHYRKLVQIQEAKSDGPPPSREGSTVSLTALIENGSEIVDPSKRASVEATAQLMFKDVHFAYPTRPDKNVFDGFNLSVKAGETLALVGPSGGGKSTTISMIERFYDPTSGIVEYEGVDLRRLNVHWLRDQIGYVGQEPTLFNSTIRKNIAYGFPEATEDDIIKAAKDANAHDFITSFPDGYDTEVGERGTQLSGGQKQRVAIARALVKNPKILLLDEATSALDSESEKVVQQALDALMASADRTTIVIAHRLSTIRNADRIAFVAGGKVKEFGTHERLMEKEKGRYRRLVESQRRGSTMESKIFKPTTLKAVAEDSDDSKKERKDMEEEIEQEESAAFDAKRARKMAMPDLKFLFVGAVGALLAGGVFPAWGIMFGLMIELLFQRVYPCPDPSGFFDPLIFGYESCSEYTDAVANDMKQTSFKYAGYWGCLVAACIIGNCLTIYGFGKASERMNKRIRDSAFASLCRQEVAFFDKRSVGAITSQLQEDAAKIHTFSGEPIRTLVIDVSSVVTGLTISFIYMWPFALLSSATIPLMGFATEIEMKTMLGSDQGDDGIEGLNSPGGIAVETLLNMRTVAALNMEEARYNDYVVSLRLSEPHLVRDSVKKGCTSGLSILIQQWVNALQFWWGGWIIFNYPDTYSFEDFLISMFALLFSLFALGAAAIGASDRKETQKSAGRIFYLLNRKSKIDPLSEEGEKLD